MSEFLVRKRLAFRLSIFVFTAVLFAGSPFLIFGDITVIAKDGVPENQVAMVQSMITAFNEVLQKEMGVHLERDVKILVDPKLRLPETTIYFATAHELFHQVQLQLSGPYKSNGYYWLSEGSADYLASLVSERVGFNKQAGWLLDRANAVRVSKDHVGLQDILEIPTDQWTYYMEKHRLPYEMADLMVAYAATKKYGIATVSALATTESLKIIKHYGDESYLNWLQALREQGDVNKAFAKVFGSTEPWNEGAKTPD